MHFYFMFLEAQEAGAPSPAVAVEAAEVVAIGLPTDGPVLAFRRVEGELRSELITNLYKLDFLLKHRSLLSEELTRLRATFNPAGIEAE